jgi:actin-related protein
MDLPEVVKEVTNGLPEDIKEDCLSQILLTGGNTDLTGFEFRLGQDLKKLLPQYSNILEVKSCPGTHSWNVALGSTYVPLAVHPGEYIFIDCKLFMNQIEVYKICLLMYYRTFER